MRPFGGIDADRAYKDSHALLSDQVKLVHSDDRHLFKLSTEGLFTVHGSSWSVNVSL